MSSFYSIHFIRQSLALTRREFSLDIEKINSSSLIRTGFLYLPAGAGR